MYRKDIEHFLIANNITYTVNGDMISSKCINPKHLDGKPGSFFFSISKGVCHCFSCGYKNFIGNITEITIDAETQRQYEYEKLVEQLRVEPDLEYEGEIVLPPKAFDIEWDLRGIPKAIIKTLGLYYCRRGKYAGRIVFPIQDMYGTLIGYTSWLAPKSALADKQDQWVEPTVKYAHAKYLHSYGLVTMDVAYPLQLDEFELKPVDYVMLTEGHFDALSLIALGYPAVCNFGLGHPSLEKIGAVMSLGYPSLVQAFDMDAPGIKGWQDIKDYWSEHIPIQKPPKILKDIWSSGSKDANDYLVNKLEGIRNV